MHAAFHSLIHQLVSTPFTPAAFEKEVDTVKHIAEANHVKLKIVVDKIICRKLQFTTYNKEDGCDLTNSKGCA